MAREQTLHHKITFLDHFLRTQSNWWRFWRMLYPSPAEVKFVRVMRGHALTFPFVKSIKHGYPLAIVWRGRILKNELVEREVRVGSKYLDFATPHARYRKGIDVDGDEWHRDVLKEQERYDYLKARGWQVLRIPARRLWREPRQVYIDVLKFLKS